VGLLLFLAKQLYSLFNLPFIIFHYHVQYSSCAILLLTTTSQYHWQLVLLTEYLAYIFLRLIHCTFVNVFMYLYIKKIILLFITLLFIFYCYAYVVLF